jgi:metal-sulfur cluster biosynthetic enzyme
MRAGNFATPANAMPSSSRSSSGSTLPPPCINVVDLGLIYDVSLDENTTATIDMTLTSAACPLTDVIEDQTRLALEGLVNDFRINWVWMPPWGPDKITDEGREMLRALGFNV